SRATGLPVPPGWTTFLSCKYRGGIRLGSCFHLSRTSSGFLDGRRHHFGEPQALGAAKVIHSHHAPVERVVRWRPRKEPPPPQPVVPELHVPGLVVIVDQGRESFRQTGEGRLSGELGLDGL